MMDQELAQNLGLREKPSLEGTRAWIERAESEPGWQAFAILAEGDHIGNVVLDLLDDHLQTARLSIYIGDPRDRNRGYGRAAIDEAARRAGELGLHKLWLTVHVGNEPAIAAYRRAGFAEEGRLRDEFILDGHRTDVLRMGLILAGRP
jgi:RimJ/RimL family protein N-acetyltransferase